MGMNDNRSLADNFKVKEVKGWPLKYKILAAVVAFVVVFAVVANLAG